MKAVIYVEVDSQAQLTHLWDTLQSSVDSGKLSGYFTLTVENKPCLQPFYRSDLQSMATRLSDCDPVTGQEYGTGA
jgi:hypothetical protein